MKICDVCETRAGCRKICDKRQKEIENRDRALKERSVLRGYYFQKDNKISHRSNIKTNRGKVK